MTSTGKQSSNRRRSRIRVGVSVALALAVAIAIVPPVGASASSNDYVNKLSLGETQRVSVSDSGAEGDDDSGRVDEGGNGYSASDDGRFIAFASKASNLHPADTNECADVFVFDRKKERLDLVSATASGVAGAAPSEEEAPERDCGSWSPRISGSGRYVAFVSRAPLTDDEDATGPFAKVFVRDLKKHETELVSATWNGEQPDGDSWDPTIADDGRTIAFISLATNLLEGPCIPIGATPECRHIYARDRTEKKTVLVSDNPPYLIFRHEVASPSISGNGRYVAYAIRSTVGPEPIVTGDDEGAPGVSLFAYACPPYAESGVCDVLVKDLQSGKTELVSVSRNGQGPANGPSGFSGSEGQLSDDGRYITFWSLATDLVPANPPFVYGDCGRWGYVRDLKTGRTERLSVSSTGSSLLRDGSGHNQLSDDGRYAMFRGSSFHEVCPTSNATDASDAYMGDFIHDRATGQVDLVSCPGNDSWPSIDTSDMGCPKIGSEYSMPSIGGNGTFIVGNHYDEGVVPNDSNDAYDVFIRAIGNYRLGVGPLASSPHQGQGSLEGRICLGPDACVPAQGALSWLAKDAPYATLNKIGAELYGASIAYRPELGDLFVAIELEHMGPGLTIGPAALAFGGASGLLYGLRFEAAGSRYEVRATSLLGGTFGLFDCTNTAPSCTQVATLEGGYGTTGERVVVSLPLDEIGLQENGEISRAEIFSAFGSLLSGPQVVYDRLELN